jgi:hypothetical protein
MELKVPVKGCISQNREKVPSPFAGRGREGEGKGGESPHPDPPRERGGRESDHDPSVKNCAFSRFGEMHPR